MEENKEIKDVVQNKKSEFTIFGRGKTLKRMYFIFTLITLLTMIAEVVLYIALEERNFEVMSTHLMLCILCLLVLNIPLFLERHYKLHIPTNIVIITFIMVFGNFIIGEIYGVYNNSNFYDKILHTLSGVIFGLVSFSIITLLNDGPTKVHLSPFFVVIFTFCCAMTAEYIWEIFEYFMDMIFGTNMQRWQTDIVGDLAAGTVNNSTGEFVHSYAAGNGLIDTMKDMIVNIFGALGVCIYAYIGLKFKPDWFVGRVIIPLEEMENIECEERETNMEQEGKNIVGKTEVAIEEKAAIADNLIDDNK